MSEVEYVVLSQFTSTFYVKRIFALSVASFQLFLNSFQTLSKILRTIRQEKFKTAQHKIQTENVSTAIPTHF
jgi:hypothetical protein